jgi:hypothetical protein
LTTEHDESSRVSGADARKVNEDLGRSVLRFTLLLAVLLVGCRSLPADDEARREEARRRDQVRIVKAEAKVEGCEPKDEVAVRPPFPMLVKAFPELSSVGTAEVEKALRYRTLLAGGDTVVHLGTDDDGTTRGRAYDCQTEG